MSLEVYADALSRESSWFREQIERLRNRNKALTKNIPLTIHLQDVEPRVFKSFVNWIHQYPKDANKHIRLKLDASDRCLSLVKAYVFGYRYGARTFARAAAYQVVHFQARSSDADSPTPFISAAAVKCLWEGSGPRSVLSLFVVSKFHLTASFDVDLEAYPKSFICAAYKRLHDSTKLFQSKSPRSFGDERAELP